MLEKFWLKLPNFSIFPTTVSIHKHTEFYSDKILFAT